MHPGYAAAYRELHERHWWWRARKALVLRELDGIRPAGTWGRVLDVGCGGGVLFDALLERAEHVEGLEPDAELIDPVGSHASRIHVRTFDPTFRPAGAPFDLVLMLDVLEHLDRRVEALAHAGALLGRGGALLVTVPALPCLWTRHDVLNEHRLRYTRATLAAEARAAGLRVRRLRYFFHWTALAKIAQRALEAARPGRPTPPRIPPPTLNRFLEGMSRIENRMGALLRPPFGSSLLMVAEPAAGGSRSGPE